MPDIEREAAFAKLGRAILVNLLYQQQFDEREISWLDMMSFAENAGLVSESIKDDDLFYTKTALAGDA